MTLIKRNGNYTAVESIGGKRRWHSTKTPNRKLAEQRAKAFFDAIRADNLRVVDLLTNRNTGTIPTFEELFEAISLKRLGIFLGPIVLVDTRGFFQPFRALFEHCIQERMMDVRHAGMWNVVDDPSQVLEAIANAPQWDEAAREFSAV